MQNSLMPTNELLVRGRNIQEISIQDKQDFYLDWQSSGLSKTEFCHQRRMSIATFYRWIREREQTQPLHPHSFPSRCPSQSRSA